LISKKHLVLLTSAVPAKSGRNTHTEI
jgi:hypothetical protein